MTSNPSGPAPADRSPLRSGRQGDDRVERYGTVAVARHAKTDGRTLILYTHVEAATTEGRTAAGEDTRAEGEPR
jgi:hypothetical protein